MTHDTNPYPVDSTYYGCCNAIGRHSRRCTAAPHPGAALRANIIEDLEQVRIDLERMIRDSPDHPTRRTRLIQLSQKVTHAINQLSVPFDAEARR
ncbi:hypothetical protein MycrhDRAFT_1977 [Mycolicibacterium rhodesiae JS60]|nr:hypothetical protein MycrhDRAFT_1977 [Mycolicibacterium rhodesiae JS60]